jgi:oligopeptide transport system substrate-binding protein
MFPILIALVAALAVACGSGGDSEPGAQTFRMRIPGDPSTFDPQLASVSEEISVAKQLFQGLFAYDRELNIVPAVAAEVPSKENGGISDDGLTYTIKLRDDATWSDGVAVTANDFVYAFQRLFDPEAGATGYYFGFYTAIDGAEAAAFDGAPLEDVAVAALDDYTLQITLAYPQPTLTTLLALWPASPLRKDLIDQYGDAWTDPGNLVGNGPFVLQDYTPNDHITLAANASYWGDDKPALASVVYRIIPDENAALLAYQNGELDMTVIPSGRAEDFEGDPEQVRYPQLETYALQYNNATAPFDNTLVRQAFSRAIDRDAFVTAVLGGVGAPAVTWLPPGMPGSDPTLGQDLAFDDDAARSLLAQAGYENGDGFPTVTLMIGDKPDNRLAAEFFKAQLGENLGISVNVEVLEEGLYYERYDAGDFQVTWQSWFADYGDPENWLALQFASDGAFNVLGYSNPQVDELLAQAAVEFDSAQRLALYDEAHQLIVEDQAVTPIYHPDRNYLVKSNVVDLFPTALDAEPGDWFVAGICIVDADAVPASCPN